MINVFQHYRSSLGVGIDYVSLLPKSLTIDPDYVAKRFDQRRNTLFKEIAVIPARELVTPHIREAFNTRPHRDESKEILLTSIYERLKQFIVERWHPEYNHVVLHSSGIDSRIISWCIRQIYLERGDDWLGNVLFVCSKWEGASFKGIMSYEGWNENQYRVILEDLPSQEYYASSLLDFRGAWKRANGTSAIPVNLFWYLVEHSGTERPIQLWSGQWGNTVLDAGSGPESGEGIRKEYKKFYWSILSQRPRYGDDVIHPYVDTELCKIIASSNIRLGKKLRFELVDFIDPTLASYVNMASDGDRHRKIADWIVEKMVSDYQSSWYGRNIAPNERPKHKTTEFQPFWSRWTSASLCDYLLDNGHEIKKG